MPTCCAAFIIPKKDLTPLQIFAITYYQQIMIDCPKLLKKEYGDLFQAKWYVMEYLTYYHFSTDRCVFDLKQLFTDLGIKCEHYWSELT